MKYLFPGLIALVVLAGVTLTVTPYVADMVVSDSKSNTLRAANPQEVRQALASWFETSLDTVTQAQGLNQVTSQSKTAWFKFSVKREPIEHFIRQNHLQQQDLTAERLNTLFDANYPPATWWNPASLGRQTCFTGLDEGRQIGLIYNAELEQGFLIVRTQQKTPNF